MKHLLLTFDLEELVFPKENNIDFPEEKAFEISKEGLEKIMKLLSKKHVVSTFFTTSEFALKYPELIEKLLRSGHEIALHGKRHIDYSKLNEKECLDELREAKAAIEKAFKTKINGFRAPGMRRISSSILQKLRIGYDSSIHPTYVPFRYNYLGRPVIPFKEKATMNIPVSVSKFRLPFSWIWFRNFGLPYAKRCTRSALDVSEYVMLYFHPWEFHELDELGLKGIYWQVYSRNSGKRLLKELENYLDFVEGYGAKSSAISNYLTNLFK